MGGGGVGDMCRATSRAWCIDAAVPRGRSFFVPPMLANLHLKHASNDPSRAVEARRARSRSFPCVPLLLLHQVLFGRAFFKRHGLQAVLAAFLEFEGQFEVSCCEDQAVSPGGPGAGAAGGGDEEGDSKGNGGRSLRGALGSNQGEGGEGGQHGGRLARQWGRGRGPMAWWLPGGSPCMPLGMP